MHISAEKWMTVRRSLEAAGDRFADLALSAPPGAMATADWTVADTVAHVVTISQCYVAMVRAPGAALPIPEVADVIPVTTVDTVADFNRVAMGAYGERDPQPLAARLRGDIAELLRSTAGLKPDEPIDWLGGSRVPAAGLLAHLLNELLIHGRDIARGAGARWEIPAPDAALFLELFLLGVTDYGYGHLLDRDGPERTGRIAVRFRSRYTEPVAMVLTDGRVTIEKPGRNVDVKLFFDPVTLNLMLFGRVSRVRAALSGRVVVWGRRPWLLPAFMGKVRLPS